MSHLTSRPSLLAAILESLPPPAVSQGHVWGADGLGHKYRFAIYDIRACPPGTRAVYIFARHEGRSYVPVYIGRAEVLGRRLPGHERRDEAIRRGAHHLLVHVPSVLDPVGYVEAERRLIRHYAPPLNEQHNLLAALLSR